jgi:acyl carrier protein
MVQFVGLTGKTLMPIAPFYETSKKEKNMDDQARTQFLRRVEDILQIQPGKINGSTVLQDLPEWDSVAALSVITMIDESYRVTLEGTEILNCPTLNHLIEMIEKRS